MNAPQYLLAKYIPDLRRGEPRNIGVIVWTPDGVEARFVSEKPGRAGEVDGRTLPAFVGSSQAYKQWVEYWRNELSKPVITSPTGGRPVRRETPEFLEALKQSSRGNFVLTDGGSLLDPVHAEDLGAAADHLFAMLVDSSAAEETRDASLDEVLDRVIDRSQVRSNPNFKTRFPVTCTVAHGIEETYEFTYAYGNGSPKRLYQRVPLPRRRDMLQKSVHNSAWIFEKVTACRQVKREDAVALVYAGAEQNADVETARMLRLLASVARVLNVSNEDQAVKEFAELPRLPLH